MRIVNLGLIQMSCTADPAANLQKALQRMEQAADQGAQIICTQELFTSLYFCDEEDYRNFELAEPVPGPTTEALMAFARKRQVVVVASLFEKRASGVFHNTAMVIDADGRYLGKYRKMHIPDDPGYYEKFYFTPGDLGYRVFHTKYGNVGVLICWDQWYPEAARIVSLMGADLIVYPTAIGWALTQDEATNREQYEAWQIIQRAHAVANGLPVAAINRVGVENGMRFWGGSFITNPFGSLLYQASHDQEETIVQPVDLDQVGYYRIHWPFLRDRRIDSYQPIIKRFIDQSAS
ncbi:carbon-nitrogen hydrolase [Thermoflavifilum thermophilum]|uniref:N-carbamoylputrescine amidase n=1 Tax=Thermoflavifilum thermophilum TaxID=1393122 RepID=A0A1I7NFW1_9BACT|nr:carbon-nitrogen hydrolase [Thermoflavifilum thermophilum]SFV33557.1 N-carbamoylputrescine amidase [Thermoflavifilum thermophilum]